MSLVRLLHTADLHLDSPLRVLTRRDAALGERVATASRRVLSRLVDTAIEREVAAILIAGDLFDSQVRSAATGAFVLEQFDRLADAGIAVFLVRGNHDAENPISGALELPSNVHVFDGRGGRSRLADTDVWIHGVSFRQRHAPESLVPKFGPPVPDAVNVAMLHTSLAGASGHDPYAPCSVAELVATGFDYWALGHVHRRTVHHESPWVVMPGCPQGRDIGEAGARSATLVTVDDGRIDIEAVPTSVVEFRRLRCELADLDDDAARGLLRETLADATRDAGPDRALVLRLTLAITPERGWRLRRDLDRWQEIAAGLAGDDVCIEKLSIDDGNAPHATAPVAAHDADAVRELGGLMHEIANESGFREAARAELERLLQELPAELRDRLAADPVAADTLIDERTASGTVLTLARMRGAAE